jgi:hypothetical protein
LGCGDGAVEALDDLGEGVADLGLFFELGLEGGKDGGVEEGGWRSGHCDCCGGDGGDVGGMRLRWRMRLRDRWKMDVDWREFSQISGWECWKFWLLTCRKRLEMALGATA